MFAKYEEVFNITTGEVAVVLLCGERYIDVMNFQNVQYMWPIKEVKSIKKIERVKK